MSYVLNFDILFAIVLVGMIFSAIFKKSKKFASNFFLFLTITVVMGVLVYFKIDEKLFTKIGGSLQPIFANSAISKIFNREGYYALFYFAFLVIADILVFLVIKLICSLFMIERRKYKKDLTYTPKHHGMVSFLTSILKFALVLEVFLIVFEFVNLKFGFDVSNSYVIKYFELYEKPLLDLLKARGDSFFKVVGYIA